MATGFQVGSSKAVETLVRTGDSAIAAELETELQVRYKLLEALSVFSIQLAQLQNESDRSQAGIRQLAGATNRLALTLGSGLPTSPFTAVATRLADGALEIREFQQVSRGLERIAPLVEEIAELLAADLRSMRKIYLEQMTEAYNQKERAAEDALDEELEARLESWQELIVRSSPETPPDAEVVALFAALYPVWIEQQREIDVLLAESRALRAELRRGDAFYAAVEAAIDGWLAAYLDLAAALAERRELNMAELYLRVQAMRVLIDTL